MEEFDASELVTVDLDELRRRRLWPDGQHLWTISLIHHVVDPEQALDDMVLGRETLLGLTGFSCLWCEGRYPDAREAPCHPVT